MKISIIPFLDKEEEEENEGVIKFKNKNMSTNAIEDASRIIDNSRPVVPEQRQTEQERREAMIALITKCEKAKQTIGDFCTIKEISGTLEQKILVLNSPIPIDTRELAQDHFGRNDYFKDSGLIIITEDGFYYTIEARIAEGHPNPQELLLGKSYFVESVKTDLLYSQKGEKYMTLYFSDGRPGGIRNANAMFLDKNGDDVILSAFEKSIADAQKEPINKITNDKNTVSTAGMVNNFLDQQ